MHDPQTGANTNASKALYVPPKWQIDPQKDGALGIVCGHELFLFAAAAPPVDRAPNHLHAAPLPGDLDLLGLLDAASTLKCAAIWIVPADGAGPSKCDLRLLRDWTSAPWQKNPRGLAKAFSIHELTARGGLGGSADLAGMVARQLDSHGRQTGAVIRIIAPWVQDGWRLNRHFSTDVLNSTSDRAAAVAGGILRASFSLGAQIRFSPSHTGLTILRQELDRWQRKGVDLSLPEEWRARFHELRATPIQWVRPGEEKLQAARSGGPPVTLWKYDRNGSYIASARAVPTGIPTMVTVPENFDISKIPMGLYRVRARPPEWFDPATMPGPFRENDQWTGAPDAAWTWEPQIRLAIRHGWRIYISEGWFWPKEQVHELLRGWQDRVWSAREATAGDQVANGIVKQVGVASIGRLIPTKGRIVMTSAEAEKQGLTPLWRFKSDAGKLTGMVEVEADAGRVDLIRPDWWSIVISNAVERLLDRCYSLARESTIMLYVDALYSTVPIAELDGPADARGKFKLEGVREVPLELLSGGDPIALVRAFAHADELPDGA